MMRETAAGRCFFALRILFETSRAFCDGYASILDENAI